MFKMIECQHVARRNFEIFVFLEELSLHFCEH